VSQLRFKLGISQVKVRNNMDWVTCLVLTILCCKWKHSWMQVPKSKNIYVLGAWGGEEKVAGWF
jgi:hypothetical protein